MSNSALGFLSQGARIHPCSERRTPKKELIAIEPEQLVSSGEDREPWRFLVGVGAAGRITCGFPVKASN
jgi:hypothetical protein